MSYLLHPHDELSLIQSFGGGKATNLARMSQMGFPVPSWIALSTRAYQEFLHQHQLREQLTPSGDLKHFEQFVEDLFLSHPLPHDVEVALRNFLEQRDVQGYVAVRSSALDEDSGEHSFAGQFSSFLFLSDWEEISKSIRKCWASGYSERGLRYRRERGLSTDDIQVGVVIQDMIDSDSSGVAFSRDPTHPLQRNSVMISSVWGQGEGLVSGALDADLFIWDRETKKIKHQVVPKTHLFVQEGQGVAQKSLSTEKQEIPSLSEEKILEVAQMAVRLEDLIGVPQDIEWSVQNGTLFLLQTRPITTLPPPSFFDESLKGDKPTLWDNSNIIESYSGVTSPLTFSFASHAYEQVYIQFCQVMNVPSSIVDTHSHVFRNMLGLVRGRVYYNLVNWYRLLSFLPGATSNAGFMETMMGLQQDLKPELHSLFDFVHQAPKYSWWKRMGLHLITIQRFWNMDSIAEGFLKDFQSTYEKARKINFQTLSLTQLKEKYDWLYKSVLRKWQAPIINDYLCMIFFGLLKKLTGSWITCEDSGSLQNDLLCGQGNIESTEPTKQLMRIAQQLDHDDETLRSWWLDRDADTIANELPHSELMRPYWILIQDFLERYGFRCINELKLEEPDLHQDPRFIYEAISSYIRSQSYSIEDMEKREQKILSQAQKIVHQSISGWKRWVYLWVLKHARKAIRHRENLRFARTKIFGVIRHLFIGMGTQLERLGVLSQAHDVFYLTTDELFQYIEGRGVSLSLSALVEQRKNEFEAYKNTPPPPDRFLTYGAVGVSMNYPQILEDADLLRGEERVSSDPNVLLGTPCCPGVVEGEVRVVHSLEDAKGLKGEILVTARTDPGWVPLYPSCSGLLIERGSLLSHSAVVARELGLPTIVGISGGLLKKLKTGDRVRVDAGKGEVYLLTPQ